jgi:hypothetical protein
MSRDSLSLMPGSQEAETSEGDDLPKLSLWDRMRFAMVKHDSAVDDKAKEEPMSTEELEEAIARTSDKERTIGLLAAPVGAAVSLFWTNHLIDNAKLLNQGTSEFQTLAFVMLGVSVLILTAALLRKRLFLGILIALEGLSLFNLHAYGFAIPFVLGGAWLLVRAYRLQQRLKLSTPGGPGTKGQGGRASTGVLPRPNKRYTPRTAPVRRPSKSKPE